MLNMLSLKRLKKEMLILIQQIITLQRTIKNGKKNINIISYTDDVLFANNEDNLQHLSHKIVTRAKDYNMIVSKRKTYYLTTAKDPRRCQLKIEGIVIEQVMTYKCLNVQIYSICYLHKEIQQQVFKGAEITGGLKDIIC